jgi:hypothetical protein
VTTSKLLCQLCQLDTTASSEEKARVYRLTKLKTHIKSGFHTRKAQIIRAYKIAAGHKKLKVPCTLCAKIPATQKLFLVHLEKEHPEELWEELNVESDEEISIISDLEVSEDETEIEVETEAEDEDDSKVKRRGKGKGKAKEIPIVRGKGKAAS